MTLSRDAISIWVKTNMWGCSSGDVALSVSAQACFKLSPRHDLSAIRSLSCFCFLSSLNSLKCDKNKILKLLDTWVREELSRRRESAELLSSTLESICLTVKSSAKSAITTKLVIFLPSSYFLDANLPPCNDGAGARERKFLSVNI